MQKLGCFFLCLFAVVLVVLLRTVAVTAAVAQVEDNVIQWLDRIRDENELAIERPDERTLLQNSVIVNFGRLAMLDYEAELLTAEIDLEIERLEESCLKDEATLTEMRKNATELYFSGGPLHFVPDPPCHHLAVDCVHLPVCLKRWDCKCAARVRPEEGVHPYPKTEAELRKLLDADKRPVSTSESRGVPDSHKAKYKSKSKHKRNTKNHRPEAKAKPQSKTEPACKVKETAEGTTAHECDADALAKFKPPVYEPTVQQNWLVPDD